MVSSMGSVKSIKCIGREATKTWVRMQRFSVLSVAFDALSKRTNLGCID